MQISQIRNAVNGQTLAEEIINSAIHALGAVLSIAGFILFMFISVRKGDPWRIASFSLYGTSMIALYLSSTLYHAARNEKHKRILRIFDYSAIYILIAGTYTPFLLISLRGVLGWSLFGVIWACAFVGILVEILKIKKPEVLSAVLFLTMGWMVIVIIRPIFAIIPSQGLQLIFLGGGFYSLGVIFFLIDSRIPFSHSMWHVFVLGGSLSFYFCHLFYVL